MLSDWRVASESHARGGLSSLLVCHGAVRMEVETKNCPGRAACDGARLHEQQTTARQRRRTSSQRRERAYLLRRCAKQPQTVGRVKSHREKLIRPIDSGSRDFANAAELPPGSRPKPAGESSESLLCSAQMWSSC
jgi:hypothetical protein